MRRIHRLVLALALLAVASCTSPSAPRYPAPDEKDPGEPDPKKSGFVVTDVGVFWA